MESYRQGDEVNFCTPKQVSHLLNSPSLWLKSLSLSGPSNPSLAARDLKFLVLVLVKINLLRTSLNSRLTTFFSYTLTPINPRTAPISLQQSHEVLFPSAKWTTITLLEFTPRLSRCFRERWKFTSRDLEPPPQIKGFKCCFSKVSQPDCCRPRWFLIMSYRLLFGCRRRRRWLFRHDHGIYILSPQRYRRL